MGITQGQLLAEINTNLPTNGVGSILAAPLRAVLDDMTTAIFQPVAGGFNLTVPNKGWWIIESATGSTTTYTPLNQLLIAADNVVATTAAGVVIGLDIPYIFGPGDQGARTTVSIEARRVGASNPANVLYQDTGVALTFHGIGNDNGTSLTPLGSGYAAFTNAALTGNATYWATLQGFQIGLECDATSSCQYQIGVRIGHSGGHASKGYLYDTALDFADDAATVVGWDALITASGVGGKNPIAPTGTFIRTYLPQTFANGIDMSSATITGKLITGPNNGTFITGATGEFHSSYGLVPSVLQVAHGGISANQVTTTNPTAAITRTEILSGGGMSGGQNASLFVESIGNNIGTECTSFASYAAQFGSGDVTGIIGRADYWGAPVGGAFGGFFWAGANTPNSVAIGIEFGILNATTKDLTWAAYSAAAPGGQVALGMDVPAGGANLCTAGLSLRASGTQWDVGIGALPGSIKTAAFQDDSSSISVLKATGAHTNGVDLSAATFTGSPIKAHFPTSSAGLASGSVWANSNVLTLVP